MNRRVFIFCMLLSTIFMAGCGDSAPKLIPTPVKGTVTLDGKPLPEGEMTFGLSNGVPPTVIKIKDGTFTGMANAGSNRVEIRAFKAGPPVAKNLSTEPDPKPNLVNYLPDRYSTQSTLKAEVTAGGANDFKFEVTSK